ncbi:unnamed protein product, partial [Symbiodinium microadriaticum]
MLATLGRGATSVAELQKSAAAMVKESRGNCSAATKMMARAGTAGKHPGNIERDIMRHLGLPLQIHWISVPVLSAKDRKTPSELRLPYLMPHELVHFLHETQQVQITKESVDQFWAHAAEHTDWAAYHEGFGAMPLGGLQKRYPLMNIREFICKGPETLNPVLEVLTWSFSQLALGYHPRLDMHGNPYQGKYTAGSPIQGWFAQCGSQLAPKMVLLCSRFKRHSQATLTSGMLGFEGGAYPSLNLKAWNSRLFVVYFEIVLRELVDSGAGADEELLHKELKLASAATTAMCAFLHGMESSPRYLTDEQCRFMHDSMQAFLELYEVLIGTSNARGTARWKAVPKHHSAWHLVEEMDRTHYNVRFYHSFADEDYI